MERYNDGDKRVMKSAYVANKTSQDRLDDLVKFGKDMGYKKIGIAYCMSVSKWAKVAEEYLSNYFEVSSTHCKIDRINSSDIVENSAGISCNPIGQSEYLNKADTDLNITMGLCIGHDITFSKYSNAPVTNLLVKDRKNGHQVIDSIEEKL